MQCVKCARLRDSPAEDIQGGLFVLVLMLRVSIRATATGKQGLPYGGLAVHGEHSSLKVHDFLRGMHLL